MLSLCACVVYVASTYFDDEDENAEIFDVLEIIFASLFSIDYLNGIYNSKNKKKFVLASPNIIDLLTIFPVFVSLIPGGQTGVGLFLKNFLGIVRVLRAFRILRLYRIFNVHYYSHDLESIS
jgi:hypothetical protein